MRWRGLEVSGDGLTRSADGIAKVPLTPPVPPCATPAPSPGSVAPSSPGSIPCETVTLLAALAGRASARAPSSLPLRHTGLGAVRKLSRVMMGDPSAATPLATRSFSATLAWRVAASATDSASSRRRLSLS